MAVSIDDNTALIGGIAAGVVALLVIVAAAVIAFVVMRNRRDVSKSQSPNHSESGTRLATSNYARIEPDTFSTAARTTMNVERSKSTIDQTSKQAKNKFVSSGGVPTTISFIHF
jgi:hypothetical protein